MFKVLLVDDEPAALEALRLAADWERMGFVICEECSDGEEALKAIERLQPDLAVTDIRMPAMDGLELVKQVRDVARIDMQFIIVSGYDEFEYAKKAMKYGIRHYVLKPVMTDEFSCILSQVRELLEKRESRKALEEESSDAGREQYFRELLAGEAVNMQNDNTLSDSSDRRVWAYAVLEADAFDFDELRMGFGEPSCTGYIPYAAPHSTNRHGMVLESCDESGLSGLTEALCTRLREICPQGFYLAVGRPAPSPGLLGQSVKEALKVLDYSFFEPTGSILRYEDFSGCPLNYSLDCIEGRDVIEDLLEELDLERLPEALESVFQSFRSHMTAPEVVEMYTANIIYKGLKLISDAGGEPEETIGRGMPDRLNSPGLSLDELKRLLTGYCLDTCRCIADIRHSGMNADMLKVKEYMAQNFRRSITIRELSVKLYMHPVYLGQLFRKWFGCSFNEYLHSLRIEEAKRLLASTELKTHEIAELVGYSIYGSFLQQFERFVSMKPVEYRNLAKIQSAGICRGEKDDG